MEFVNTFNTHIQKEDTGIYTQNTKHDDNCYFENRLTEPKEPLYTNYVNDNCNNTIDINSTENVFYSPNYTKPSKSTDISPDLTPINNPIPSHYQMLIQNVDNKNESSLINASDSYNIDSSQVNFNYNDFSENNTIEGDYLLPSKYAQNLDQTKLLSVTSNQTYKNPEFWKSQVPEIMTNEYLVRDIPEIFYDKSNSNIERFTLPKNNQPPNSNFFKGEETRYNVLEPKVSQNYYTTYTVENNKVVHEGNKKRNNLKHKYNTVGNNTRVNDYKYKTNQDYSIPDRQGMLVYYDDNKDVSYTNEFGVAMNKQELVDPNGNTYNKFMRSENNEGEIIDFNFYKKRMDIKDITGYERNIMLNRNNNLLASTNYTMQYD